MITFRRVFIFSRSFSRGTQSGSLNSSELLSKISDTKSQESKLPPGDMGPEAYWKHIDNSVDILPPLGPYAGRSVKIAPGVPLPVAYSKLSSLLARNKVRQELRAMNRHEKASEKRNRLKSQRWRRAFADMVRRKVQLVQAIRARGA